MRVPLQAIPPFNFTTVLDSHGWVQLTPFGRGEDGALTYVAQLDSGRVAEVVVRAAGTGVEVAVGDDLTSGEQAQIVQMATWMLGLAQDFSAFYALAHTEPKLAHVEQNAQGRMLRSPTLFEDVVKTILTTNTTWSGTKRMAAALAQHYGAALPADGTRHAFPRPERLAAADPDALRQGAKLGYRAPYIRELGERVVSGALDLESLKDPALPTAEVRKQLLAIKGVGGYAAATLLMLLGHYDAVPVDSWARKLVSHEWYGGQPIGDAEVEEAFAAWGPWKGLVYWNWKWAYHGEG
jgi:3-methyladenine DNA glycosylase/8-oxoguanine DNA glycosylase